MRENSVFNTIRNGFLFLSERVKPKEERYIDSNEICRMSAIETELELRVPGASAAKVICEQIRGTRLLGFKGTGLNLVLMASRENLYISGRESKDQFSIIVKCLDHVDPYHVKLLKTDSAVSHTASIGARFEKA